MVMYYMVNYYIKYIELIDTVFLVLKKKPLGGSLIMAHGNILIQCVFTSTSS